MDEVTLYLENVGEDDVLVGVGEREYTTPEVVGMIAEIAGRLEDDGNVRVSRAVLAALEQFINPPKGSAPIVAEEISDCDRFTCLRTLEAMRKSEDADEELRQHIFVISYLLRGYACHCP
ncbi:MAG: hypothetical protein IK055_06480 [Lachnospiraceae bacterium]|nr:hypothetical protein [Lachnospiraceae bacterium]